MTTETMTIHRALAELKVLDDRIMKLLSEAKFCGAAKNCMQKLGGVTIEEYKQNAQSTYDKITDLMARQAAIKRAVSESNAVTHAVVCGHDYTVAQLKSERRVICFRDDNFSVDSKSRFADIVDRIPLDADEFIKALTDAIKAEHDKGGRSYEADLKKQAAEKKDVESVQAERAKQYVGAAQAEEDEPHRAEWISAIQDRFGNASADVKAQIKAIRDEIGLKFSDPEFPIDALKRVYSLV